jgi:hypothetical protein
MAALLEKSLQQFGLRKIVPSAIDMSAARHAVAVNRL